MKKYCAALIVLVAIASLSCKKDKQTGDSAPAPSTQKKVIVTTLAGDGVAGFADGTVLTARFNVPLDIAVTPEGTVFVADGFNNRIRKIAAGQVTTFAGTGIHGTTNGNGIGASFSVPSRLGIDIAGNLYTLEADHPLIRQVTPAAFVAVHAGIGINGFKDGAAVIAQFGESFGIVNDADGNMYVSDSENRRIRKISAAGEVTTVAGNGKQGFLNGDKNTAEFFFPAGIVIDKKGNLLVGDQHHIRKITPSGQVSTFAGNNSPGFADGQPSLAQFTLIEDMVIDNEENIFVSDNSRVRKVSPDGVVTTIAGSDAGFADGTGASAKFNIIQGLGIDKQGNIYVADVNNHRIRKISFE